MKRVLLRICLSIGGGSFLALSLPGYNLWLIAWVALSLLFYLLNISKNVKEVLIYSFLFGFFYNFFGLKWLFSLHPLTWLGLSEKESLFVSFFAFLIPVIYSSLFFILFGVLAYLLKNSSIEPYNKGVFKILLVTLIWLIVFNKIASSQFLLGFPWTLLEYSQYRNLYLIQIAEYTGGVGVAFLIVFFNLVLGDILTDVFNKEKIGGRYISKSPGNLGTVFISFTFIIILISLSLISGLFSYNFNRQKFSYNSFAVSILQGNLPIKATRGQKLDIKLASNVYEGLLGKKSADLFIAPEGSLPTYITHDYETRKWLERNSKNLNSELVFGSYCKNNKNEITNCSVLNTGGKFLYYAKKRLVPFGEYVPFYSILPKTLKKFADFSIGEGFATGNNNEPVASRFGRIGINICFELIFPELIRKHSIKNSDLIVNLSDLSWFGNDLVRKQFLAFGVFRAIENRKPVIIATNNGISAFIEPNGTVRKKSLTGVKALLSDWVTPNNKITFYAKYGW